MLRHIQQDVSSDRLKQVLHMLYHCAMDTTTNLVLPQESLSVATDIIKSTPYGNWSLLDMKKALYSLQNYSSDRADVLELVAALTAALRKFRYPFDQQTLDVCLLGLRGMSISVPEV